VMSAMEDQPISQVWPRWSRHSGVRLVTTIFDLIPMRFPDQYFLGRLKHPMAGRYEIHRQADVVMCISALVQAEAVELVGINPERSVVVPAGFDAEFLGPGALEVSRQAASRLGVKRSFVLAVGNVDPRKNLLALLDAVGQIPSDTWRDRQLVLTSSQYDAAHLDRLTDVARRNGLQDSLVVLEELSDVDMAALYRTCDVMVYPSLSEGLGLPIMEAMSCGAAVLTSDRPPMSDLVGLPAALCDPTSIESIAQKLEAILRHDKIAAALRADGLARSASFRWEPGVDAALSALDRCIDG
jgi:glycosyltransferase involved in cell wall biosynthesis